MFGLDYEFSMYPGSDKKKFVWWVVVCKPILVFSFGSNRALGLGLRLGPGQTKICGLCSKQALPGTPAAAMVVHDASL